MTDFPDQEMFNLLPRLESRRHSFVISFAVNLVIVCICVGIGMIAPRVIERHYEVTELFAPIMPPHVKTVHLHPPIPRKQIEEPKPVHTEAKLTAPPRPHIKPSPVHLARPTLAAAMPAQNKLVHPVVKPVHLGETFGVTPNPNAIRTATVAALGNPYGDMRGAAVAPQGMVKSAGLGDSTRFGAGGGGGAVSGRVGSVGMPGYTPVSAGPVVASSERQSTSVEVISKPPVRYPTEARQMRIEGDVVLSVTFSASGQVQVHGVLRGLGHGLDEEAVRVAEQIRFHPATVNGRPVDVTTHVTIAFQLA
jgi:TonB family protein